MPNKRNESDFDLQPALTIESLLFECARSHYSKCCLTSGVFGFKKVALYSHK
ncbi:hypothetical protein HMPREF0541_02693 [Lacticaseibacillus rhamnosus ATCC 21052]|nr:hypothetical protein HMPREF0541_02693 [Lacticaseibacillus rhamnosus ATCC 21052]